MGSRPCVHARSWGESSVSVLAWLLCCPYIVPSATRYFFSFSLSNFPQIFFWFLLFHIFLKKGIYYYFYSSFPLVWAFLPLPLFLLWHKEGTTYSKMTISKKCLHCDTKLLSSYGHNFSSSAWEKIIKWTPVSIVLVSQSKPGEIRL